MSCIHHSASKSGTDRPSSWGECRIEGLCSALELFKARIGYEFRNERLLLEALVAPEHRGKTSADASRIEFGASILRLCLADQLYHSFPTFDEGELVERINNLLDRRNVAAVGRSIGLDRVAVFSGGLTEAEIEGKSVVVSDFMYAIAIAAFLDGGIDGAKSFVCTSYGRQLIDPEVARNPYNELRRLLDLRQRHEAPTFTFSHEGPPHDRRFHATCHHRNCVLGSGGGRTLKDARIAACEAAVKWLKNQTSPGSSKDGSDAPEPNFHE